MAEHRALRALKALRDIHLAAETIAGDRVEIGRWGRINPEDCPFISIEMGPDVAVDQFGTDALNHIDSVHRVWIDLYESTTLEAEALVERLFEMRAESHIAILADTQLGLPAFVISTRYQGAEEPDREQEGARKVTMLRTEWDVAYRMLYTDPTT